MAKSIKLQNDTYIDSTGIVYNHTRLDKKLEATDTAIQNAQNTASSALSENSNNSSKLARWGRFWNIGGTLGSSNMWWRVLKLPHNFCGILCITTPNYSGTMNNNMVKLAYSYGNPVLENLTTTAFGGKKFSTLRLCYTTGSSAYLELQANGNIGDIRVEITFVGSMADGSFSELNEIGTDINYSTISVTL